MTVFSVLYRAKIAAPIAPHSCDFSDTNISLFSFFERVLTIPLFFETPPVMIDFLQRGVK